MTHSDETGLAVTRVCRKCSAQSTSGGTHCPSCGTPFIRRSWRPSRKQSVVTVIVLGILLASAGGVVAKQRHDASERDRHNAEAAEAARDRQEAADAEQAEAEAAERESRREIVKALEKAITKDAKKHVRNGVLDGPILYTSCTATGGGSTDDLTALTGTFECLAATKENKDGTISGYAFQGTADWQAGDITWHLGR